MFSPRKQKAVDMLALGVHTYTEVAAECNVTQVTLRRWRAQPDFAEAVLEASRQLLKDRLPSIYNVLSDNAMTGSHQHIKLVLEHLHKLEELRQVAEEGSVTFTWRNTPPQPEEVWEVDDTKQAR